MSTGTAAPTLLARLRAGDDAAFEELVRTHGPRMLAVARRFLRRPEDAQDAVQEAFLCAFRSLPAFDGEALLSTWLHRIVVNAALMRLRRARRKPEAALEDALPAFDGQGRHAGAVEDWTGRADHALWRREVVEQVRGAIGRLAEPYRTVLLLRDVDELDTEETARMLGITPQAVKTRLHRARQALRTLLAPAFAPQSPAPASGPARGLVSAVLVS